MSSRKGLLYSIANRLAPIPGLSFLRDYMDSIDQKRASVNVILGDKIGIAKDAAAAVRDTKGLAKGSSSDQEKKDLEKKVQDDDDLENPQAQF